MNEKIKVVTATDTLAKLTQRIVVIFVVVAVVVLVGQAWLTKRSIDAGNQRSQQTDDIADIQDQLVCFAERSERFSLAVSSVLRVSLEPSLEENPPEQRDALKNALEQLEEYQREVAEGTLECNASG